MEIIQIEVKLWHSCFQVFKGKIMGVKKTYPPTTIPTLISIVMLLAGIPQVFPYGYYTLLRLVVSGTSVYIAYFSFEEARKIIGAISILFAFIFNPLIPLYLGKEIWALIDIIAALFFAITIFVLRFESKHGIEFKTVISKVRETKSEDEELEKELIEKSKREEEFRKKIEEYDKKIERMLAKSEMLAEADKIKEADQEAKLKAETEREKKRKEEKEKQEAFKRKKEEDDKEIERMLAESEMVDENDEIEVTDKELELKAEAERENKRKEKIEKEEALKRKKEQYEKETERMLAESEMFDEN